MDMKLEVVVLPVADVDRAKQFYKSLGWREDADFTGDAAFRIVQLTPPGSACSIHFGTGVSTAAPGSMRSMHLVVDDIEAARTELVGRGVAVGEIFHDKAGVGPARFRPEDASLRDPGPATSSYGSFAAFRDPDGNEWLLQEITTRLPGR